VQRFLHILFLLGYKSKKVDIYSNKNEKKEKIMFIVFNKQKIYSYLVALSTVVILFVIAFAVTNSPKDVLQTSTNVQDENNVIVNQINK